MPLLHHLLYRLYHLYPSSSSSSSVSAVWELSSQISDTTSTTTCSDQEQCDVYLSSQDSKSSVTQSTSHRPWTSRSSQVPDARSVRQNPRRTSNGAVTRKGPPSLARQSERKVSFVDKLVDSSTQIVEAIWPLASVFHRQELGPKAVLPLRTFIQETLRRSRTSYSTLQVALYYLILIKPHVPHHDFTMEQPEDLPAIRALQCGRRMFLAALILASKYLQDRNYSARAWSKISGLATAEINQNERLFLSAVNWKLHITNTVFKRWTEVVLEHGPSQPPPSGSAASLQVFEDQCREWKNLVLALSPDLDNIEELIAVSPAQQRVLTSFSEIPTPVASPSPVSRVASALTIESTYATPTPEDVIATPTVMEPVPVTVHTPGRLAPALGLLPTPRLTPQSTGFYTPAVATTAALLGGKCSMSFAMAQAAQVSASHCLDRWPCTVSTSPRSYVSGRHPSLATSISAASSPESMVSDSSRSSRSSSISSASSLVSAPSVKLDVQARCRNAMLCSERYGVKPAIASVPEDLNEEDLITFPSESYTGTVGKDLGRMTLKTPMARADSDTDDVVDAARTLQGLHKYRGLEAQTRPTTRPTTRPALKRSRRFSSENVLQENVRALLATQGYGDNGNWQEKPESKPLADVNGRQTSVYTSHDGCRKRLCCSTEAMNYVIPAIHPAVGGAGGPGMWEGILN
ncbi:hypothetical protein F5Y17DRAFT_321834 [Xylariaceae sp. FL0594]|nr:hypothetical protein F5Y17DRAFT_321834 [Xylariaceae sp. FL0594]